MSRIMKLITNTIIFAIATASIVAAAVPQLFWSKGLELKRPSDTCPTWWIDYTVIDDSGKKYLTGYFEFPGCYQDHGYFTLGDGTFTLGVTHENYTAVLKETSSGLTIKGAMYPDRPPFDDDGGETICWFGGGPEIPDTRYPFCYGDMAHGFSEN